MHLRNNNILRALVSETDGKNMELWADIDSSLMEQMDAIHRHPRRRQFLRVGGCTVGQDGDILHRIRQKSARTDTCTRHKNGWYCAIRHRPWRRWPICPPSHSKTTILMYAAWITPRWGREMESLKALMNKTDKVRITGPGTDLSFFHQGA